MPTSRYCALCVCYCSSNIVISTFGTEHLKPVDVKIAQLGEALESVSAEIRYLQNRDLRHRRSKSATFLSFYSLREQETSNGNRK